ncbi:MAG: D-glycero-beta-D-manno-heptose 1-phosphate adenylyltransferase [Candidatus Zixiibacteriota bacterium]
MIKSRKIKTLKELIRIRKGLKRRRKSVVFTNGCFDILHRGHIEYLKKAKTLGEVLIVGLNSDSSVREIKGKKRPIVPQDDRAEIIASLEMVDYVLIFRETTPFKVILNLVPDVLVKGGDYTVDKIVGNRIVESAGGRVITVKQVPGRSTKNIIRKIVHRYNQL